jgi:site-specific DNA recombinase
MNYAGDFFSTLLGSHPEQMMQALQRSQTGAWLPQQLQAQRQNLNQALAHLARQEERLLEAYLTEVIELAELERKRQDIAHKQQALDRQLHLLEAQLHKQVEIDAIAPSIEAFCQRVQQGLAQATFDQKRELLELLIDRVIVDDAQVEIRYVIPTTGASTHTRFCHLRKDYLDAVPLAVALWQKPPLRAAASHPQHRFQKKTAFYFVTDIHPWALPQKGDNFDPLIIC